MLHAEASQVNHDHFATVLLQYLQMKKWLAIVVGIAVGLVAGYFSLNSYIYNQKQDDNPPQSVTNFDDCARAGYPIVDSDPEQCETPDGIRYVDDGQSSAILQGTLECLPHRDTSGPTTTECSFGLLHGKTDEYYALRDPDPTQPILGSIPTGTDVRVTGNLTLEQHDTYQSIGTVEVTQVIEQ